MNDNADTLYDRLGGRDGIAALSRDILRLHHANPVLNRRYSHAKRSDAELERLLTELLCSAAGGREVYTGMSMAEAHRGMNIHPDEFMEALDDILTALEENGVSRRDRDTLLGIGYALKPDIIGI
ncbi:group I truncated hemoglobin [Mycobacterium sp. SMC-14]|uniref:group I truncated hemoglobin n=1 Tax=Mycobacterium sp. SMC-14 TaxID=3385968 RepID=UPI00390C5478